MPTFGNVLKNLRKEEGKTQKELAAALGLAFSTVSMYERGEREPDFDTIRLIADYFNVTIDYLYGMQTDRSGTLPSPSLTDNFTVFPVIGEIAAGYNHIAVEDWSGEVIEIPNSYLKGHRKEDFFVLSVKGSSMFPMYQNGDMVLILKQSTLNHSGEIGAILYDDDCATLKRIEYAEGEDWLRLIPVNPNFEPETIEGERLEHCRIIGIPRLLIRNLC